MSLRINGAKNWFDSWLAVRPARNAFCPLIVAAKSNSAGQWESWTNDAERRSVSCESPMRVDMEEDKKGSWGRSSDEMRRQEENEEKARKKIEIVVCASFHPMTNALWGSGFEWGRNTGLSNRPLAESPVMKTIPRAFVRLCFYGLILSAAVPGVFNGTKVARSCKA